MSTSIADIEDVDGSALVPVICTTTGANTNIPSNTITQMPVTIQGGTSVTNIDAFTTGYD